jgi:hypothetical protein
VSLADYRISGSPFAEDARNLAGGKTIGPEFGQERNPFICPGHDFPFFRAAAGKVNPDNLIKISGQPLGIVACAIQSTR